MSQKYRLGELTLPEGVPALGEVRQRIGTHQGAHHVRTVIRQQAELPIDQSSSPESGTFALQADCLRQRESHHPGPCVIIALHGAKERAHVGMPAHEYRARVSWQPEDGLPPDRGEEHGLAGFLGHAMEMDHRMHGLERLPHTVVLANRYPTRGDHGIARAQGLLKRRADAGQIITDGEWRLLHGDPRFAERGHQHALIAGMDQARAIALRPDELIAGPHQAHMRLQCHHHFIDAP